jgi:hypothetical protein
MRVSDGSKRLTIRMACIDAPEAAQRPYGAAFRQRLQELAPVGVVVTLRPQTAPGWRWPWRSIISFWLACWPPPICNVNTAASITELEQRLTPMEGRRLDPAATRLGRARTSADADHLR